jgi:hypothetical protein
MKIAGARPYGRSIDLLSIRGAFLAHAARMKSGS